MPPSAVGQVRNLRGAWSALAVPDAPVAAISMSKDGGLNWGNPLIRQVGQQGSGLRQRVAVKNMGLSGSMGDRWRVDISDPVDFSFFGGTQSSDPRSVG